MTRLRWQAWSLACLLVGTAVLGCYQSGQPDAGKVSASSTSTVSATPTAPTNTVAPPASTKLAAGTKAIALAVPGMH